MRIFDSMEMQRDAFHGNHNSAIRGIVDLPMIRYRYIALTRSMQQHLTPNLGSQAVR